MRTVAASCPSASHSHSRLCTEQDLARQIDQKGGDAAIFPQASRSGVSVGLDLADGPAGTGPGQAPGTVILLPFPGRAPPIPERSVCTLLRRAADARLLRIAVRGTPWRSSSVMRGSPDLQWKCPASCSRRLLGPIVRAAPDHANLDPTPICGISRRATRARRARSRSQRAWQQRPRLRADAPTIVNVRRITRRRPRTGQCERANLMLGVRPFSDTEPCPRWIALIEPTTDWTKQDIVRACISTLQLLLSREVAQHGKQ